MKSIIITIFFMVIISTYQFAQPDSINAGHTEWEAFPILNYDSDAGFGYGGKGFLYNF